MKVYSYFEAQDHLDTILDEALDKGQAYLSDQQGRMFVLQALEIHSHLDVRSVQLKNPIDREEIVSLLREVRAREF
ncbi:MAG: hypothetical protein R2880_21400 [Deinococcales bacterium]